MGILIDALQAFQLNILQVLIAGLILFAIGNLMGKRKVKKLHEEIGKLEKNVMELNSELLFGNEETKVIRFKKSPQKKKVMAN
jgi:hypothetical protein